jgi:hypothetical protein
MKYREFLSKELLRDNAIDHICLIGLLRGQKVLATKGYD